MPTRTIDTQTFEGEQIQCAKFVSDEPFSWKAARIISAETDYEFQMVAKSSVATMLTIQVGDTVKTQAITTEFTRFVIPFPSVTNDVDSLYISFPSGTYWLYNLQLERASTPSAWRPAPEDAEDYADQAAQTAVDNQTQLDIFNKLTNNGTAQGVYLLDGQLYINGEYIAADTISGNKIHGGTISGTQINIGDGTFVVDSNGQVNSSNMNITGGSLIVESEWIYNEPVIEIYANRSISGGRTERNGSIVRHGVVSVYNNTDENNNTRVIIGDHTIQLLILDNGTQTEMVRIDGIGITHINSTNGAKAELKFSTGTHGYEFKLTDSNGKTRAVLGESSLTFYDSNGTVKNVFPATGNPTIRT